MVALLQHDAGPLEAQQLVTLVPLEEAASATGGAGASGRRRNLCGLDVFSLLVGTSLGLVGLRIRRRRATRGRSATW